VRQKRRAGRSKGEEIDTRVGGLGDSARVGDFLNMKARSACRGRETNMGAYFQSVCPVAGLVYRIHQMHGGSQLKYNYDSVKLLSRVGQSTVTEFEVFLLPRD